MNRRTARGRGPKVDAGPLQAGLARIDALIAAGQFANAVEVLAELDNRFHDNPEVLLRLLTMAIKADDVQAILAAAEPLARLQPDDPVVALNLAIPRLKTRHLALAHRAFASFAARWSEHEQAEQARLQGDELASYLATLWTENGLTGPPDLDLMARNEEVQNLITAGDWQQAVASAQINIFIAEGKFDGAESWLEMWERADPEHPNIDYVRGRPREVRRAGRRKC